MPPLSLSLQAAVRRRLGSLGSAFQLLLLSDTLMLLSLMVGQTHRMLAMPQDFRARMTAVNMMVMQVAGVLGPGLAGMLLLRGSVDGAYGLFGIGLFLFGLGYLWVPGYREFLNLPHVQAEGRYAREHPALFH